MKPDLADYTYVFASTLNQIVNYIPVKMYSFKDMYSVSLFTDKKANKKVSENKKWDQNLSSVLQESDIKTIKIDQKQFIKVSETIKEFRKTLKDEKVVWNITSGQRPYLLAVLEFIKNREEDYILYLEGNTGLISLKKVNTLEETFPYHFDSDLATALKLMGFKTQNTFQFPNSTTPNEESFWTDLYWSYCNSETLRTQFVLLNKKKDKNGNDIPSKTPIWNSIYKELGLKIGSNTNLLEEYRQSSQLYPFGYILEKMVFHKLIHCFKSKVIQIYSSLKSFSNGDQIDEFDIVALTNEGQIINFECKSGIMDGDVAKSTKYSTYAIAGVYGLPILITPLLEEEFEVKPSYPFEKSYKAINAAERADLKVWGIDEIKNNFETIIKKINS